MTTITSFRRIRLLTYRKLGGHSFCRRFEIDTVYRRAVFALEISLLHLDLNDYVFKKEHCRQCQKFVVCFKGVLTTRNSKPMLAPQSVQKFRSRKAAKSMNKIVWSNSNGKVCLIQFLWARLDVA